MFDPNNDADWDTRDLEDAARDAANGVCSICEEPLDPFLPKWDLIWTERYTRQDLGPVDPDGPWHVRCTEDRGFYS